MEGLWVISKIIHSFHGPDHQKQTLMKSILVKKFGSILGLLALAALVAGFTLAPSSCSLTPEQQQRLQSIAVPATSLGLAYAQSQGLIEPGDRITITQGVAIVVSDKTTEAKLFDLTELGLKEALRKGLIQDGNVITLTNPNTASIAVPSGPANPLLPPP